MSEALTFVVIHGACHTGEHVQTLCDELASKGHNVINPTLRSGDTSLSFNDDAKLIIDAIGDADNIVTVTHSRGAEVPPRILSRASVDKDRFIGAVVMNSAGPHDFELTPGRLALPRYTPQYIESVVPDGPDRFMFDPNKVRDVLFSDVSDAIATKAITMLVGQRQSKSNQAPLPYWPSEIPMLVMQGADDQAIVLDSADAVNDKYYYKPETIKLPGGHSLYLAQPSLVADVILDFAQSVR